MSKFTVNAENVQGAIQADKIANISQNFQSPQSGGIRAKRIVAENIVDGVQIQGADSQAAENLIHIAKEIQRGGITADDIRAKNIVSGLQYITDPAKSNSADFKKELEVLKQRFNEAVKAGEFADAGDIEDAKEALEKVETEVKTKEPTGTRIVRKLDEFTKIMTKSAEAMKAAGNLKAYVIKLAPYAAAIWLAAQNIWK